MAVVAVKEVKDARKIERKEKKSVGDDKLKSSVYSCLILMSMSEV